MISGRPRRTAWAICLSLVLHVAALIGMVMGLEVAAPPPDRRAVELELIPAPPRPSPPHTTLEHESTASSRRVRPAPAPSLQDSVVDLPETPTPAPAPKTEAGRQSDGGPRGLSPSLNGRTGCDDALGLHLTPAQHQTCISNSAQWARQARPLDLNIPNRQRLEYDRYARCRDFFHNEPVVQPSQQVTETGTHFTPADANKCPMADRF
jgi:hypothetical protein